MLSSHRGIVQHEVGQSKLHFWVESFSSSLFLLDLFGMVPPIDILGMDLELSGFFSDYLLKRGLVVLDLLSDRGNQLFFEFDGVTFVCDGSFSLLRSASFDLGLVP